VNDKFPLISVERYQTWSILDLSVVSALHHVPLLMAVVGNLFTITGRINAGSSLAGRKNTWF